MRVVFAGTPEPAVVALQRLVSSPHEVAAVVSRPDKAKGRGRTVQASPVARFAREHEIPLLQPVSARTDAFRDELTNLAPDICVVVAYGALLPAEVLAVPPQGWVNLHFSVLPQWRGAAPVQHALWHGDDVTGATTFRLDEGMDTGPVFGTVTTAISATDTSGTLLARLAEFGSELLIQTLAGIESGAISAVPQTDEGSSLAPKIESGQARIDWSLPAHIIDRRIRACTPAPGAWSMLGDLRLRVGPVEVMASHDAIPPGTIGVSEGVVLVGTGTHPVALDHVTPAGKREMAAGDWWRGLRTDEEPRLT